MKKDFRRFNALVGATLYLSSITIPPTAREENIYDELESTIIREYPENKDYLIKNLKMAEYINYLVANNNYDLESITHSLELVGQGGYRLPKNFRPYCVDRTQPIGVLGFPNENGEMIWSHWFFGNSLDGYIGLEDNYWNYLSFADDLLDQVMELDSKLTRDINKSNNCISLPEGYTLCGFKKSEGMFVLETKPAVFEEYEAQAVHFENLKLYPYSALNNPELTYVGVRDEIVNIILNGRKLSEQIIAKYYGQDNIRH